LRDLAIEDYVQVMPFLSRDVLAAVYRRAALLLQPSEAEGFGLPIVEAMACGCPVVASELPALREVGGSSAAYCPIGDIKAWSDTVIRLMRERGEENGGWRRRCEEAVAHASLFSWTESARRTADIYKTVLTSTRP
jgi:glycosyltransferase involved in cell wall biosynthesis